MEQDAGSDEHLVMAECGNEFRNGDEKRLFAQLLPPTNEVVEVGLWTYIVNLDPVLALGAEKQGVFLAPGSVVKVDKRANSNGKPNRESQACLQNRLWLRISDGSGWVPETDENGKKLMLLQNTDEVSYPSWFKPEIDPNKPKESKFLWCSYDEHLTKSVLERLEEERIRREIDKDECIVPLCCVTSEGQKF